MSGNKLVDLSMEFAVEVLKIWIKTKLSHKWQFFNVNKSTSCAGGTKKL